MVFGVESEFDGMPDRWGVNRRLLSARVSSPSLINGARSGGQCVSEGGQSCSQNLQS